MSMENPQEKQENDDLELASSSFNNESKELIPQADPGETGQESNSEDLDIDIDKPKHHKRHIPSASSALIIGSVIGILQAIFLILLAKPLLKYIGINSESPMLPSAQRYLTLRSLGAPAVLLSLAMQGVFRGFKDKRTPIYATVAGDATNIILDPIFIFTFRMGVSGAAIAHVISQYIISAIPFWILLQQVDLLPPHFKDLQFGSFLKNGEPLDGGFCFWYMKLHHKIVTSCQFRFSVLMRVVAATFCVTLAASLAAHHLWRHFRSACKFG